MREYAGPCDVAITPATGLDFGTLPPGKGAVLGVKIVNRGENLCAVKNIALTSDAGGVFFMPGGVIDGLVVWPGDYFSFQVAAKMPDAPGDFTGELQIEPSDPANPRIALPLRAHSQESCIVALPSYLDFGVARPDCPPPPAGFTLTNQCTAPVEITSVTIGPGTTDGEFTIAALDGSLPHTLAAGRQLRGRGELPRPGPGDEPLAALRRHDRAAAAATSSRCSASRTRRWSRPIASPSRTGARSTSSSSSTTPPRWSRSSRS